MNAGKVTKTIEVPEAGAAVIRKLSGRHLEAARVSQQGRLLEAYRRWSAFQLELGTAAPTNAAEPVEAETPAEATEPAAPNPLASYDPYVIVAKGLLSVASGDEVTPEFVEDFDDETLVFVAEAILRLSAPRLFLTADAAEVAQKNG